MPSDQTQDPAVSSDAQKRGSMLTPVSIVSSLSASSTAACGTPIRLILGARRIRIIPPAFPNKRYRHGTMVQQAPTQPPHHDPLFAWTSRARTAMPRVMTRSQSAINQEVVSSATLRRAIKHAHRSRQSFYAMEEMQRGRASRCTPDIVRLIQKACLMYSSHSETLQMAVTLYSRFLQVQYVHSATQCRMVALCVSALAAKFLDESDVYYSKMSVYLELPGHASRTLIAMEKKIMRALDWNIYCSTPHTVAWLIMSSCTPQAGLLHPLCVSLMKRVEQVLAMLLTVDRVFTESLGVDSYSLVRMVIDECLLAEDCGMVVPPGCAHLLPEMRFLLLQSRQTPYGESLHDQVRMLARQVLSIEGINV